MASPTEVSLNDKQAEAWAHYVDNAPNHTTASCPYPMRAMCRHRVELDEIAELLTLYDRVLLPDGTLIQGWGA